MSHRFFPPIAKMAAFLSTGWGEYLSTVLVIGATLPTTHSRRPEAFHLGCQFREHLGNDVCDRVDAAWRSRFHEHLSALNGVLLKRVGLEHSEARKTLAKLNARFLCPRELGMFESVSRIPEDGKARPPLPGRFDIHRHS
jgi:hypothetical protein